APSPSARASPPGTGAGHPPSRAPGRGRRPRPAVSRRGRSSTNGGALSSVAEDAQSVARCNRCAMTAERERVHTFGRLEDGLRQASDWYHWGPYLSERQWGTVREDYSEGGTAWEALPHEQARSRAYRWGEDGLAGFCDVEQRLCLALALWNGRDPI